MLIKTRIFNNIEYNIIDDKSQNFYINALYNNVTLYRPFLKT